jgi:hypothetical protein
MYKSLFWDSAPTSVRCAVRFLFAILVFGSCAILLGNDSAVETGAGGIQLRKEARISMEKERLTISLKKVVVEYEFLNTSDGDITTEVAFPIPPYKLDPFFGGRPDFSSFRVWVDGQELKYHTQVRAEIHGVDYAHLLSSLGISIQDFGHYNVSAAKGKSQMATLAKSEREKLVRLGLIENDGEPDWTTSVTYYWSQRFPAHKTLHVRHEYAPMWGHCPTSEMEFRKMLKEACIDPSLQKRLREFPTQELEKHGGRQPTREAEWVKYILTTANTWKTPIKDFELVLEEPDPGLRDPQYVGVSVCWEGELRRVDENHLITRKSDFIPKTELVVYYFEDYYKAGFGEQLK